MMTNDHCDPMTVKVTGARAGERRWTGMVRSLSISLLSATLLHAGTAGAVPSLLGGQNSGSGSGSGGKILVIDPITGEAEPVGPTGLDEVNGLSCRSDGVLYGTGGVTDDGVVVTIDRTTGVGTDVGLSGFPAIMGLVFAPDGVLYGSALTLGATADTLVTIDPGTGAASAVGPYGAGITGMDGLAASAAGVLYGVTGVDDIAAPGPALYTIDAATGAATLMGPLLDVGAAPPIDPPQAIGFLTDGVLLVTTEEGVLLDVDPATGAFSVIGDEIGQPVAGLSFCACDPAPADAACEAPAKGRLLIGDKFDDRKDKLGWKWNKGTASLAEFGDPVGGDTHFIMCVYDDSTLVSSATIPPAGDCATGGCWAASGTKGFKYKDKAGGADGITKIGMKQGIGKAKIGIKGKGANLRMPASLPLTNAIAATVQLFKLDGPECWQTTFDAPASKNDSSAFKAKLP